MQTKNQITEQNQQLVSEHMQFAIAIAKKFKRQRPNLDIDLDDYIAAAFLGLCDAASRYRSDEGSSFRTYSYLRIRGSLYELLRKTIGISRSCFEEVTNRDSSVHNEASADSDDEVDDRRSSFVMCNDIDGLSSLAVVIEEYGLRIHRQGEDGPALSYANGFDPEEFAANQSLERCLQRSMSNLNEKQKQVVRRRYYHSETFDEIALELGGASRSWLSRMHTKALGSMREQIQHEDLQCSARVSHYDC